MEGQDCGGVIAIYLQSMCFSEVCVLTAHTLSLEDIKATWYFELRHVQAHSSDMSASVSMHFHVSKGITAYWTQLIFYIFPGYILSKEPLPHVQI